MQLVQHGLVARLQLASASQISNSQTENNTRNNGNKVIYSHECVKNTECVINTVLMHTYSYSSRSLYACALLNNALQWVPSVSFKTIVAASTDCRK